MPLKLGLAVWFWRSAVTAQPRYCRGSSGLAVVIGVGCRWVRVSVVRFGAEVRSVQVSHLRRLFARPEQQGYQSKKHAEGNVAHYHFHSPSNCARPKPGGDEGAEQ